MPASCARRRRLADGDRGSVSVELAVVFPVFLVLLLSIVQTALWWHARNLTLAAARAGVDAGRSLHADDATARRVAQSYTRRVGSGVLEDVGIDTAGSTPTTLRVRVTGTAPRVLPIPGLNFVVSQSAAAGREVFSTPGSPP